MEEFEEQQIHVLELLKVPFTFKNLSLLLRTGKLL